MPPTARLWLGAGAALAGVAAVIAAADPLPPSATYRPLPTLPFAVVKANDEAEKLSCCLRALPEAFNHGLISVLQDGSRRCPRGCSNGTRSQSSAVPCC